VARSVIAGGDPWPLSVIAGTDLGADAMKIKEFHAQRKRLRANRSDRGESGVE